MKARFSSQQQPVKVVQADGMAYVFICLNETRGTETYPDMGDGQTTESYYEYDYNQFRVEKGALEKEDVQKEPEKFLSDIPGKESEEERRLKELERITKEEMTLINQQLIETNQQLTETQMGIIDLYEMMQGGNEDE